ncbi:MAG: hypothetical protein JNJ56_08415 [Ignavibacteria bacterium]|nr:hypothetical protein [Ignavibacteria bacterium]
MGKPKLFLSGLTLLFLSTLFFSFKANESNYPNTIAASLDIETLNWLSRVDSAGGTVSDSVIAAVDDYVKEVKGLKYQSTSIRSYLLRENWFCGDFAASEVPVFINGNGSSASLGLPKDVNHNYSSAGYTDTGIASGLKGNGVNRYVETGFNPYLISEIGISDAHLMIYSMTDTVDQGRIGCRKNSDGMYFYPRYTNGNCYFEVNSTVENSVTVPSTKGYLLIQRNSPQFVDMYYRDNLILSAQNNSTVEPNSEFTIGAFNNSGTVTGFTKFQLGGYSIGRSFSPAMQLVHYNAVQRLMLRLRREIPGDNTADFKSKLFTFTGSALSVNFKTRNEGRIQFELQDQNGIPFNGYSIDDCMPLSGDSYNYIVNWNTGGNLSSFVNTPVYLRIRMDDADLFSIQFKNKVAETDSSIAGFKTGTYKQFFADTLMFSNVIPVGRKMHNPVKNPVPVISPVYDWEGNSLVTSYSNITHSKSAFSDQMVYKMWLLVRNSLGGYPAYYESADGENWTKPDLGFFKYNGSSDNNILSDVRPISVITVVDDSAYNKTDSTRRYKSVFNTHTSVSNSKLNVSFSYDGLSWIPYSGNPLRHSGEDLNTAGWNPVLGKYLGYFRDSLGIRKVGRYTSDDWINWTYTGTILKAESFDVKTTQFYNMTVLFKDSVYWGFAGVLRLNEAGHEYPDNPSRTDNTTFIALLFSRDGINFVRCGNTQPFLSYGDLGSWDDQMVYTIGNPVLIGNEHYFYYNGFNFKHFTNGNPPPPADGGPKKSQVGLAKIGLDRFLSLSNY